MALAFYHNSAGTQPINAANPDSATGAVPQGGTFEDIRQIYLRGQSGRTYKNVSVTAKSVPADMTVQYSTSSSGPWNNTLNLSDGTFSTAVGFYRRVRRPNVQGPFKVPDPGSSVPAIEHEVTFDEYIN